MWFVDSAGIAEEIGVYYQGTNYGPVSIDFFLNSFCGGSSTEVAYLVCFIVLALAVAVWYFMSLR